jgi:phosphate transport system substrate-binding protein
MSRSTRRGVCLALWSLAAPLLASLSCPAQDAEQQVSVQEIRQVLDSIDPYLPRGEQSGEVDLFGSTSMDVYAHGLAIGFAKFHPQAKVVISAAGSETVFERLAQNPSGIGMLSRPVTDEDLDQLKKLGLQNPAAVMVCREALAVFVHESNPLETITSQQMMTLFCLPEEGEKKSEDQQLTWAALGITGELAEQPVDVITRDVKSGTHTFAERFLFRGHKLRPAKQTFTSNAEVTKAIEQNPLAVAICGLKCGAHSAKALDLRQSTTIYPSDDHSVLLGQYPLTRPMTMVLDLGQTSTEAQAAREFVRYALGQAGQSQAILSGFFPFDPPTLRGEMLKLGSDAQPSPAP